MQHKNDVKQMKNIWENDEKTEFLLHLGPIVAQKLDLWDTHPKVLAISMWSNTDVKPVKTFW